MITLAAMAAAVTTIPLEVEIQHLRSSKGLVHGCLTGDPRHFPDCRGDPRAVKITVPATTSLIRVQVPGPGTYALTIFHDQNGNNRLDTMLGIPREGFGFSRNPKIRFGAPKFDDVRIDIAPGIRRQTVRLQYLL